MNPQKKEFIGGKCQMESQLKEKCKTCSDNADCIKDCACCSCDCSCHIKMESQPSSKDKLDWQKDFYKKWDDNFFGFPHPRTSIIRVYIKSLLSSEKQNLLQEILDELPLNDYVGAVKEVRQIILNHMGR